MPLSSINPGPTLKKSDVVVHRPTVPPEILRHIFGLLPNDGAFAFRRNNRDPLLACSQVSSYWRAVAFPRVWSRLGLACRPSSVCILDKLERFLADARSHGTKSLDYAACVEKIELAMPLRDGGPTVNMPDVIRSIIQILALFDRQQLQHIVVSFPIEHKESNDCDGEGPTILSVFVPYIAGLRSLRVDGGFTYSDDLNHLLQHLPATLETLHLGSYYDSTDPLSPNAAKPNNCSATIDHLLSLPKLRDLDLDLDFDIDLGPRFDLTLAALPTALRVWGPRFRRLVLRGCSGAGYNNVVETLATWCPRLVRLEIRCDAEVEGTGVSDPAMCALVLGCPKLEELCLVGLGGLSDEFLACCATRSGKLKRLVIVNSPKVTGTKVIDMAGWGVLEEIQIFGRTRGYKLNLEFKQLVVNGCPALKYCRLGTTHVLLRELES